MMDSHITIIIRGIGGLPIKLFFLYAKGIKRLSLIPLSLIFVFSSLSCSTKDDSGTKFGSSQIGIIAPEFTLNDINGNRITLSDFRGKVILIQFWATWCPLCRNSIMELGPVYEKYKSKGFTILAISIDTGQDVKNKLVAFAEQYRMSYHVLIGDKKTTSRYSVNAIPTSFLVDKEGRIRSYYLGYQPDSANELSKTIGELL